ncbi:hypothetical protein AB0G15_13785 [Streptosporangium sp. NPDC023825]|uniref:hypothetical protein n=1 Tax=Streptosporangium sp. NPDC023825 TaxID=3154909 RepID=UPI00341F0B54
MGPPPRGEAFSRCSVVGAPGHQAAKQPPATAAATPPFILVERAHYALMPGVPQVVGPAEGFRG